METNISNVFIVATRNKYRFPYHGSIMVEDLWDLDVNALDYIFKTLNSKLKKESEESLLSSPTKENSEVKNKIEIIKYIVSVKQAEAKERENAAENKAKREKIMEIISKKQDAELKDKSVDELMKMLDDLQ